MGSLEQYIKDNREAFDSGELPHGSKERFMKKLERDSRRRRYMTFAAVAGIAASLLAVFFIGQPQSGIRQGASGTKKYVAALHSLNEEITEMSSVFDDRIAAEFLKTAKDILDEGTAFESQLPEELSDSEKEEILKEYYEKQANGLRRIKEYIAMESLNN